MPPCTSHTFKHPNHLSGPPLGNIKPGTALQMKLTRAEQRGIITSTDLLPTLPLTLHSMQLFFFVAHCLHMFILFSTWTLKAFSAAAFLLSFSLASQSPACTGLFLFLCRTSHLLFLNHNNPANPILHLIEISLCSNPALQYVNNFLTYISPDLGDEHL